MVARRGKKSRKVRHKRKRRTHKRVFPGQRGGSDLGVVSRIVLQTSNKPIPENVVTMLKAHIKNWEYLFFTDQEILTFFQENADEEFKDIANVFNSFTTGPHKADIFRYYYIYMHGGVFIDSDLMLYADIDSIVGDKKFVSVWALRPEGSVFNGFLAACPKHPIVYAALKDLYALKNDALQNDYTLVCKHLGDFVRAGPSEGVKMLKEVENNDKYCKIQDSESGQIPLIHYQSMDIPAVAP